MTQFKSSEKWLKNGHKLNMKQSATFFLPFLVIFTYLSI